MLTENWCDVTLTFYNPVMGNASKIETAYDSVEGGDVSVEIWVECLSESLHTHISLVPVHKPFFRNDFSSGQLAGQISELFIAKGAASR